MNRPASSVACESPGACGEWNSLCAADRVVGAELLAVSACPMQIRLRRQYLTCKNTACRAELETAHDGVEGQMITCPRPALTYPECGSTATSCGDDLYVRLLDWYCDPCHQNCERCYHNKQS